MRPVHELIDTHEPAWPLVEQWVREAAVDVQVLAAEPEASAAALHATQVTTRSPMGAIAYQAAGLLVDSGWLRVLGAGGHPRFRRSLPGWNEGRSDGFYLVADDVLGGSFALNGGALGEDPGHVYYFAPDTLRWEPCGFGYSQFLVWAMSGPLADFYEPFRWPGWQAEVGQLTADQSLSIYPPLFTEGPPLEQRSRKPVSMVELYDLQFHLLAQFDSP